MTKAICPCGNPAPSSVMICNRCVKATSRRLGDQVALAGELEITMTRQAKLDPAPEGGRSAATNLDWQNIGPQYLEQITRRDMKRHKASAPVKWKASDLLAEQKRLLTRWCVTCVRDLHTPEPSAYTVRGLSMHIEAHLKDLRRHPKAGDLVVDLTDLGTRIIACIDRQDRTQVIGPCPTETETGYCPGEVKAFIPLSDPDSKRPSTMECATCDISWPPEQWTSLARLITKRKAAA